ncbi:hypothetical protein CP533_4627 [Ophiocordyceps camponoti-saundersi (nom. inval.)]|nr:hypothetical protein CP533_4627 [Ophiocordyceps camponoti-saundersi (nom. inval.)]
MFPLLFLGALFASTLVSASPLLEPRGVCNEGTQLVCYDQAPQGLDLADVKYAAKVLRSIARRNSDPPRWTMSSPSDVDCPEWTMTISNIGSLLVLTKQINPRIVSSVTYEDIANTIDGGEAASDADRANSLLACGSNGGQRGVKVNKQSPAYQAADFKEGRVKARGIIIKLVKNPNPDDDDE